VIDTIEEPVPVVPSLRLVDPLPTDRSE